MAKLHQMNVRYVALEDRLMLSLRMDDNSEIKLWLTRRFAKGLLVALNQLGSEQMDVPKDQPEEIKAALKSFHRDKALMQMDFASSYQQTDAEHPLGDNPLLVSRLQFNKSKDGRATIKMGVVGGNEINLPLNAELLLALAKIVQEGANTAGWGIDESSLEGAEEANQSAAKDKVLH